MLFNKGILIINWFDRENIYEIIVSDTGIGIEIED